MNNKGIFLLLIVGFAFAQQTIPYLYQGGEKQDNVYSQPFKDGSGTVIDDINRVSFDGNTTLIAHWGNGYCYGVTAVDSVIYFGNGVYFEIVDISDPDNLVEIGSYITQVLFDIAVSGDYVYLASGASGLYIIDIAAPSSPIEVGHFTTGGQAVGIFVHDRYAYVATLGNGLRIIEIADPTTPQEVGYFTGNIVYDVTVSGSYAYLAAGNDGLRIIDITTPSNPVEVGYYETSGTAEGVALSGSYVYLAVTNDGLRIIDITDPTTPQEGGYWYNGGPHDVAVKGSYAYVAAGNAGLRIIDITNPAAPQHVGYYDTPGSAVGVAVTGDYACVADWNDGLYIIRNDLLLSTKSEVNVVPRSFTLHQNYPNPFNPSTTIRYDLPVRSQVNLVIYDLLGREVRQLVNGIQEPGYQTLIWDGNDAQGRNVPAGVYLYRLEAGDFTQMRKLVVLK